MDNTEHGSHNRLARGRQEPRVHSCKQERQPPALFVLALPEPAQLEPVPVR